MKRKVQILLAEDDADDRFIFDNFLGGRTDIEILPYAENGNDVFDFLNGLKKDEPLPDIIILDHNMPKMNGRQTLEQLKENERYAQIPVFIYSTYADTQLVDSCTQSGALRVATKPVTEIGYQNLLDDFLSVVKYSTCQQRQ